MDINDDLYWDCDDANSDEVRWAELLIQDAAVTPNIFNTFEWLRDCVARLESPDTHLPMIESEELSDNFNLTNRPQDTPNVLMREWRGIQTLESLKATAIKAGIYKTDPTDYCSDPQFNQSPLETFLRLIRRGSYPSPELLLSVAKSIDLYFIAQGKLSLEEVFFGPKKRRRKGNYAARSIKYFKGVSYMDFHDIAIPDQGFSEATDRSNLSLEEQGLRFLENYIGEEGHESLCEDDLESFLRGYRRWKRAAADR